ncbi:MULTISPECIES: ion channel [unclassified Sphingomonas]|uniref:ion channel n=1 Tax=unclassified Sphingomonas TaxID=196159 RepID=UPI001F57F9A9|nr:MULTISPECIES: ion channel [unclassified Sphingomonas]
MTRHPRRQIVQLGGFPAVKTGAPSPYDDLYYWVMEMSWPWFIALVSASFVAINLVFGTIYALLPGAIGTMAPGSVVDGFFFSVDTLGTVGYGVMAPVTRLGHAIAAVEILIGLFFSATITGLIFARFARPRESLIFSDVAVIGRYQGKRALMARIASKRSRPLADATAQMSWLELVHVGDGRTFRRMTELPLVRNQNPMLGLAWTLVHILDDDSPVLDALANGTERFILTLSVSGIDTLLASQSLGGKRYGRETILVDHEFVDVISDDNGTTHLDLRLLHDTVPIGDAVLTIGSA